VSHCSRAWKFRPRRSGPVRFIVAKTADNTIAALIARTIV
jgi:hypothetical protein